MATGNINALFKELKGALGKSIVIKQYKNKTVITAYPTKNNKKPTQLQKLYQDDFKKAIQYAQSILRNPVKKKAYEKKIKEGETVYHYAIKEYKRKMGIKADGKAGGKGSQAFKA
jgi:hypothetical protein